MAATVARVPSRGDSFGLPDGPLLLEDDEPFLAEVKQAPSVPTSVNVLFFLLGVGLAVSYSAVLFQTDFFIVCLGYGESFVRVTFAAFNLPVLPVYLIQTRFDARFNSQYGTFATSVFRVVACQVLMAVPLVVLPFSGHNPALLVILLVLAGAANGAGFSTIASLASSFSSKCTTFLLLGTGASTFLLLAVNLAVGGALCSVHDATIDKGARAVFYSISFVVVLLSVLWLLMLLRSPSGVRVCSERDFEIGEAGVSAAQAEFNTDPDLLDDSYRQMDDHAEDESRRRLKVGDGQSEGAIATLWRAAKQAKWPLLLALSVSFPSYIAYPLYPYFKGPLAFRSNIFYFDAMASLFGRQFLIVRRGRLLNTHFVTFAFALVRSVGYLIFFFVIASRGTHVADGVFIPVFLFWSASNGYLGTLPYEFSSRLFDSSVDQRQAGMALNIIFTLATYGSAIFNFLITPRVVN